VAKHASGAHSIRITLVRVGNLKFEVVDDAPGFSLNGNAAANSDGAEAA
jgi:signal transduction histidine kinase